MNTVRIASIALLLIGLGLTSGASAATKLETDAACYGEGDRGVAEGTGFIIGATYKVTLGGESFGSGTVDANGGFTGKFTAPELAIGTGEKSFKLKATDGATSATTIFRVSEFTADFKPSSGNVRKVKVRFTGYGFGVGPNVYLHYISPKGTVKRTVKLGKTVGTCGSFKSKKRRLFPFDPRTGKWTLQIDAKQKYSSKQRSIRIPVRVHSLN